VAAAQRRGLSFHVGNIFSADLFYTPDPAVFDLMERFGILGVEMETAGIYTIAAELGAEALAVCTVSDLIRSGTALSPAERQTSFDEMISLALETAFGSAG
jgi:purine-nucleoside phosphorylase